MILIASCAHRNEPCRMTSTTDLQVSKGSSSIGTGGAPKPALLKRKSRRPPNAFLVSAKRVFTSSGLPTSARTATILPPPGLGHGDGLVELLLAAAGDHHVPAVALQRQRRRAADAAAAARDERNLALRRHTRISRAERLQTPRHPTAIEARSARPLPRATPRCCCRHERNARSSHCVLDKAARGWQYLTTWLTIAMPSSIWPLLRSPTRRGAPSSTAWRGNRSWPSPRLRHPSRCRCRR